MIKDPLEALEKHFGHRQFLDGQEPVVSALLSGRDVMAIMPTGGGKSLCYQLPAMVMSGVTIIVSPLIALMKDQVDALQEKGVPAAMINSTQSLDEQRETQNLLRTGQLKLIYVAPERFRSESFKNALRQVEISLFAVDEAHCLSQWGHDFRPDYMRLKQTLEELGHPQTAAFTATATPQVRGDILNTLQLRDPFVSITGFERPNLSLRVRQVESAKEKYDHLRKVAKEWKTGIVYCSTRKRVDEVAETLMEDGLKVIGYHGGMSDVDREDAQNQFLRREVDVVVATNAFGMGIDRSDVRFVVHFDVPGSIEAYYQEAGRAGRDREPAVCELLFNYADTSTQDFFLDGNNPGVGLIRDIYSAILNNADDQQQVMATLKDIAEWADAKNGMAVGSAISTLTRAGYLQRFDIPGARMRGTKVLQPRVQPQDLVLDETGLAAKEKSDRDKLKGMISFSYDDGCRQEWILQYFGETESTPCGTCDMCQDDGAGERREGSEEEALALRKVLSGVARMSNKGRAGWIGRYGRGKIVSMLVGSKAADILDKRLDQLTTYGLMKEDGTAYVFAVLKEAEKSGLVVTEGREYPLMTLTTKGNEVMMGRHKVRLTWPDRDKLRKKASKKTKTGAAVAQLSELGFDNKLFAKLKELRSRIAKEEGGKPSYLIFTNQALEFFTRLRPQTMEQGLKIPGVGRVKAERYLEAFLIVIRHHVESKKS